MSAKINPKTGYSNSVLAVSAIGSALLLIATFVFAYVMKDETVARVLNALVAAALVIPFHAAFNFFMNRKMSK